MKVSHQETYLKQVHPTSMVHGQRDSPDQGWKAGMWSDRQCLAALRNAPSSSALVLEVWLSSAEYVKLLSLASTVLREGKCVIIARPPEGSLPSTKLVALLQQKEVLAFFFFLISIHYAMRAELGYWVRRDCLKQPAGFKSNSISLFSIFIHQLVLSCNSEIPQLSGNSKGKSSYQTCFLSATSVAVPLLKTRDPYQLTAAAHLVHDNLPLSWFCHIDHLLYHVVGILILHHGV